MHLLNLDGDIKAVAVPICSLVIADPVSFLTRLRVKMPEVMLQALDAKYVADLDHLYAVIKQSWAAHKRGVSNVKFDLDILLRIACDSRLMKAINTVGLKKGVNDVIFVCVGAKANIIKSVNILKPLGNISSGLIQPAKEKDEFLKKHHGITDVALHSVLDKKNSLSSILSERSAITITGRK